MKRVFYLLLAAFLLAVALVGCFARTLPEGKNDSSQEGTSGPPSNGPGKEPFVTWDKNVVIPFVFSSREPQGLVDTYYLGLWDLKEGKVSLGEKPLFSIRGTYRMCWDGGDRFGFLPVVPDKFSLITTDPRVRADVIKNVKMAPCSPLIACPSDGGTFLVYEDENKNLVLDIRDHPLSGKVILETELAPYTVLFRGVSVQASADEVRVYCETSRPETREVDGRLVEDTVHGILEVRYVGPTAMKPQIWRTIHPDIGVTEAGAGAVFTQCGKSLLIGNGMASTRALDLLTGKMEPFTAVWEELKKADPNYTQSAPGDLDPAPDLTFTYAGYVVSSSSYTLVGKGGSHVHHCVALKDGQIVGRLWFDGKNLRVFRGVDNTFEVNLPGGSGGVIRFPVEMQEVESFSDAWAKSFGPKEFDAIWMSARYPDLFNEVLRCDGWTAEEMSVVLTKRFEKEPSNFVRALGSASPKEAKLVGQLLAYNASRDLDAFRKKVESLKEQFSGENEKQAADVILEQIDNFRKLGR